MSYLVCAGKPPGQRYALAGRLCCFLLAPALCASPSGGAGVQITYLWHQHQPIYWNDQKESGDDQYENAWESIQAKDRGRVHPMNDLREIFGKDDRVAAYQWRMRDAVAGMPGQPNAGVQVSYSGALMENIHSLANAGQLGYSVGWQNAVRQAWSWNTRSVHPRLDLVNFSYHHGLVALLSERTLEMEILLHREQMARTWGTGRPHRGYFPTEMCFSERMIPVLKRLGIEWTIVANNHLSRVCENFPLVLGSGGENCDPPNRADVLNPAQTSYHRKQIDRGCSPCNAYPFAYTPHRAQWVNPETGAIEKIIVVPAAMAMGWDDGYRCFSTADVDPIAGANNPNRPMLVLLAHDGDNAFGGGYSYYHECLPNFLNAALGRGWAPTTIEQYLADFPVPDNDVVKVEDGGWVYADSDFGSPIFINWNYPLLDASGRVDPENGWHEKERDMAIFTACENRVRTAEQIDGRAVRIGHVLDPGADTTPVERAWHYYLGSLDSGNVYFGPALDLEVKATLGCNEAIQHTDPVIGNGAQDRTAPTIWLPQRHPYNPGSRNYGVQYGYREYLSNGDFHVWTFASDVSGIVRAEFKYRTDHDGRNPLESTQNETYAGGSEVGPWQTMAMTRRVFPKGNVYNNPNIDFFELPVYIADHYWVHVTGLRDTLIDYYVEMEDARGNVARTPIQHVYIGDGQGSVPGGRVTSVPSPPRAGEPVTLSYNAVGGPLANAQSVRIHLGFNGWTNVVSPDPAMTYNASSQRWEYTFSVPAGTAVIDCVFNNGSGTWDNNNGADWHLPVVPGPTATPTPTETAGGPTRTPTRTATATPTRVAGDFVMDALLDAGVPQISTAGMGLWAQVAGDVLYVATVDAGEGNDHFIFVSDQVNAPSASPWAKAGTVAGKAFFLADENENAFVGWFAATGALLAAGQFGTAQASGNGGQYLEGQINLRQAFGGSLPAIVYIAAAPYPTQDGGALLAFAQSPATVNQDGNIDAGEYAALATAGQPDSDGDGLADTLEGFPPASGQGNRFLPDSDGDGLADGVEDANRNGTREIGETDLRNADTDGDRLEDGLELRLAYNPLNPSSPGGPLADTDGDRLPDGADPSPTDPDADSDRYSDGYEAAVIGLAAVLDSGLFPALGDPSGDAAVTNLDALIVQAVFVLLTDPATVASRNGDSNRDGHITNLDALALQSFFLRMVARLPLGL